MKQTVKLLTLFVIFCSFSQLSTAQIKSPFSKATALTADMGKILKDYPNHFSSLRGDLISKNPQSTDYACNFTPAGAEDCMITLYSSNQRTIASWQATMFASENFQDAKKKFRSFYGQLNNKNMTVGSNTYQLKGDYEEPVESKDFISIYFTVANADVNTERIVVELALHAEMMEWKISVKVYDRERKDEERGKIYEDGVEKDRY